MKSYTFPNRFAKKLALNCQELIDHIIELLKSGELICLFNVKKQRNYEEYWNGQHHITFFNRPIIQTSKLCKLLITSFCYDFWICMLGELMISIVSLKEKRRVLSIKVIFSWELLQIQKFKTIYSFIFRFFCEEYEHLEYFIFSSNTKIYHYFVIIIFTICFYLYLITFYK